MQEKYIEVTLIKTALSNPVLDKMLSSVNTYLLRNKGAVSDFNLIKDVVERNTDAVDEEINSLLPIPLYLGLMGTMIGIVIGLFAMPGISDTNFENAIDMLIGGVKIAMIASFIGLLLTVVLSGYKYKGTKLYAEGLKNDFFTWIQTQLLPVLSQNISSSIYALQANLLKFNDTFSANVGSFNGVMNKILHSFDSQINLMNELKEVDVVQLAKLNVHVFQELRVSTKEFEKFNQYLNQLNVFVDNAHKLNHSINNQLDRTYDLEKVAGAIGTGIETNKLLINVLQSDLKEISDRKQLMKDAVIDVDKAFEKSLDDLKRHINEQITAIKNITIKEEDLLEKLLKEDRGNLNELKKLGELKTGMSILEKETKSQNEKLEQLNKTLENLAGILAKPAAPVVKVPEVIKYAAYVFVGSGAILGVGYCFWTIYKILS
ncbi:coiled-coil domain-containing protein [Flavobacterium akiainvivens]|uniref:hypothetical protein n=1 Tax=Flavobacterium akiainvivens TaxID=1202724 RepID=UPI0006C84625|nr:hypothetical protein [Flavobacterium akiainvivens]SFQ43953.1 hypothetical protein SAMN05444144_104298 [Flavobacterium akiainvivens]